MMPKGHPSQKGQCPGCSPWREQQQQQNKTNKQTKTKPRRPYQKNK
jgi:hypothetical protein